MDIRLQVHKSKRSSCRLLQAAARKYGWDNMTLELLHQDITLSEANILESHYINHFNTMAPNGYNLTTGGDNYTRSEETRKLMSDSAKKRPKRSQEVINKTNKNPEKIAKTAEKHRGMKRSLQAKHAMSESKKAFIARNGNPLLGTKVFHNPKDPSQMKQCKVEDAPEGWILGNPKKKNTVPLIHKETGTIKRFPRGTILEGWDIWHAKYKKL